MYSATTATLPREVFTQPTLAPRGTVRLRDTVIPFGPFKGATFDQLRWMRAGDAIGDVVCSDDTEGVRYLDRLRAEPWLYGGFKQRLEAYLCHPNLRYDLAVAYSTTVRDERTGERVPAGNWFDKLAVANYGDGDDGSLKPSDFDIQATYDGSSWRWMTAQRWADQGPGAKAKARRGPGGYDAEPVADDTVWDMESILAREAKTDGRQDLDDLRPDAWQDFSSWEDEAYDWEEVPECKTRRVTLFVRANGKREIAGRDYARGRHADEFVAEEVSVEAWSRGLDVASEIDRIGGPGVRLDTLADWDAENERLGLLLAKAKYLLGSRTYPGEWADAVPEAVRTLLTDAVLRARERLDEGLEVLA